MPIALSFEKLILVCIDISLNINIDKYLYANNMIEFTTYMIKLIILSFNI